MKCFAVLLISAIVAAGAPGWAQEAGKGMDEMKKKENGRVKLPEPKYDGSMSVEKAIKNRRSVREYTGEALTLAEAGQFLWAAYGVTEPVTNGPAFLRGGLRAAPSAGARYPLEVYLIAGKVTGLAAGVYRYVSEEHALVRVQEGDLRGALCEAAYGQEWIREAPASLAITAIFERTTKKYGQRGSERYVWMDAGYLGENVYLQAQALGFGCCVAGAFSDDEVRKAMKLPENEAPVCLLAVGKKK
jgi:SagB-type dehydrogenase family enzyme